MKNYASSWPSPAASPLRRTLWSRRKQLQVATRAWEQTAAIIARFFNVKAEDLA
jgi:hypothetical protein